MFEVIRRVIEKQRIKAQESLWLGEEQLEELDLIEQHEKEIVRLGCSLKDLGIKLGRQEKAIRTIRDRMTEHLERSAE